MKHILKTENGDVEFGSQEELEKYFMGEKVELEKIGENIYKVIISNPKQ